MNKFLAIFLSISLTCILQAGIIQETIEIAAKVSGKVMSSSSKKAAELVLTKAVTQYGDDAIKIARHGGIEAIKHGAKYGDDFWRLAKNASPSGMRTLALHADTLMPLAKRLGNNFIKLESKVPGLASRVVNEFGDNAVAHLAAKASPNDISKLLGYAAKADSPATKKLLWESYKKGGSTFLNNLNSKAILTAGLSTAMIVAAYKISNGVEDGIKDISIKNPDVAVKFFSKLVSPFQWFLIIIASLFIVPVFFKWRYFLRNKKEPNTVNNVNNESNNDSKLTN
jgi:hypothetical protein